MEYLVSYAMKNEQQYLNLLELLLKAPIKTDRTGTGTRSLFGHHMRFDLQEGFPILTTKKVHFKSVVGELLWFLSGSTHVSDLQKLGVTIWDEWATKAQCQRFGRSEGDLGPIYGHQWRNFNGHCDQISTVLHDIKTNPDSRRLIVSGWNPCEATQVALPPCHTLFQFYVREGVLSCQLYQRSADAFLGVPFNIASYALLTHMVANECNLIPGEFIWTGGDVHLYLNHQEQARTQLCRTPMQAPTLKIKPAKFFEYTLEDFELLGYTHHPAIKAEVAV